MNLSMLAGKTLAESTAYLDPTEGESSPPVTYRWATVTQASPLRVRLDGETVELPVTPESLVKSAGLAVSTRVWVQLYGRRLIILGAHLGGVPDPTPELAPMPPIGSVLLWSGGIIPSAQWLWCDGAAVSRTTYAQLWAICYTVYGAGDGSTTFNVPDFDPVGSANYIIRAL